MIDDVLVHCKSQQEHDQRLIAALEKLRKTKVTLNKDKCNFFKHSIKFFGKIIGQSGVHPDPEKVKAIWAMKELENTTD